MTAEVLDRPTEQDDLALWDLDKAIQCDFLDKATKKRCVLVAKHRIKVWCLACTNHGILWACELHFERVKADEFGCAKCGTYGNVKWELI